MPRRRRHFVERTVHTVADFEIGFERLEVNVARAILNCLREDEVHIAYDRRRIRFALEFLQVDLSVLAKGDCAAEFLEDFVERSRIGTVVFFDEVLDLVERRDDRLDILSEGKAQVFKSL